MRWLSFAVRLLTSAVAAVRCLCVPAVSVCQWHIVKGLPIDAQTQKLIDTTTKELMEEKNEAFSS